MLKDTTTKTVAGSILLGGSYGYGYTSHQYARDYGFGPRVSHGIGEISAGLLLSKVATIKVSRGFGPSQSFIDATSNLPKKVNNFRVWSIGIIYQADNQKK